MLFITVKSCGDPGDIQHATKAGHYNYQDTVTYSCITGYERTSGDGARTCQEDKTWSGLEAVCTSESPNRHH